MPERWKISILRICESLHAHARGMQITPNADQRIEYLRNKLLHWKPSADMYDRAVHDILDITVVEFTAWQRRSQH